MEPTIDGHATLRDRDMLCFSHDWNGDPLSKTHLMRLLARRNRVLWVNSIGYRAPSISRHDAGRAMKKALAALSPLQEPEPNLFVLNPVAVPAHGKPWVRSFNRWLLQHQVRSAMSGLGFDRPINWVFNPAASVVAGTLDEDLLIYYCVDEYSAFHGVRAESLRAMEDDLLAKADLVITSAERLWHTKKQSNPATYLVRHGVDWQHFRRALDPRTPIPADLASIRGPILGYFGLIGSDWVDQNLIESVACRMPNVSIVMIGKITTDVARLRALPNVHLLGHRPYSSLPGYCRGFDAAFIPFPISDATLNANPLKAREYLAAGLPVVSTAIPEVESLGLCRIAGDATEFAIHVAEAMAHPGPQRQLSEAMRTESWESRLAEVERHIASISALRRNGASHARTGCERLAA